MNETIENILNIGCSPEQPLSLPWITGADVAVTVKRDDLLHPVISGNKWRKLKYALLPIATKVKAQEHLHIVSFGGGFSNHIHALAYCCHQLNQHGNYLRFTPIIRGDYSAHLTPMLNDIINWGAQVNYVDRITYKKRTQKAYLEALKFTYESQFATQVSIIPEGGSQHSALPGLSELIAELTTHYDYILCPVASGGTMAGLITALQSVHSKVVGVAVLKGKEYLQQLVTELLPVTCRNTNWSIVDDFHFGGYAKKTSVLVDFCEEFHAESGIEIETVYSGKLFFALKQLITQNYFPPKSRILVIHTGGLQGARGA